MPEAHIEDLLVRIQALTDHAAAAFYSVWVDAGGRAPAGRVSAQDSLASLAKDLDRLQSACDAELTVKVPEGFEFYGLYPEQYCASALRWAAEHSSVRGPLLSALKSANGSRTMRISPGSAKEVGGMWLPD